MYNSFRSFKHLGEKSIKGMHKFYRENIITLWKHIKEAPSKEKTI